MEEAHYRIVKGTEVLSTVHRYGNYAMEHPEIKQTVLQHIAAVLQISCSMILRAKHSGGLLNEHIIDNAILSMYLGHGIYAPGYDVPLADRTDADAVKEYDHFQELIVDLPEFERHRRNEAYLLQWCSADAKEKDPPTGLPANAYETIRHLKRQYPGEAIYLTTLTYFESIAFARQMYKDHGHLTMYVQVLRNAVRKLESMRRGRDLMYSLWTYKDHDEAVAFINQHPEVPEEKRAA